MNNTLESALCQVAVLTFEELGFVFPAAELDERQQGADADAAVSVAFRGSFSGTLVVRMCGGVLPGLTANMLGDDEEPTEQLQRDALGEIANVICGNLLPALAGRRDVFNLDAPEAIACDPWPTGGGADRPIAETCIGLEEGRADLVLYAALSEMW